MAKLSIIGGTTSKSVKVFVQNNSVSTGAGLTGLTNSTSGLAAYYAREGASSTTAISLVSATLGTWTSGGFIVADATNMPGVYELGLPNAAIASGAKSVLVYLQGATNMAPVVLEIELTAVDNQNANNYGLGVLPASAAAGAAGGLWILGANTGTVTLTATSGNNTALSISGTGTGNGVVFNSGTGATGDGFQVNALSSLGNGLIGNGSGTGAGIWGHSSNGYGIEASGLIAACALFPIGAANGLIINSTGADAISIAVTGGTNGNGVSIAGRGTGSGLAINAGLTGTGVTIAGGSTSGHGVAITSNAGDCVTISAGSGNGIIASGTGVLSAGIQAVGNAGALTAIGISTLNQAQVTGGAYPIATDGSGNVTIGAYKSGEDPATLVLGATAATWNTSGTIGHAINSSGGSANTAALRTGTAQGGTSTTIQLDAGAPVTANSYVGGIAAITGGTGAGQQAPITAYNTSTKTCTIYGPGSGGTWSVTPDSTSTFAIYAGGPGTVQVGTGAGQLSITSGVASVNVTQLAGIGVVNDGAGSIGVDMGQTLPTTPSANTIGESLYYASQRFERRNTAQGGTSTTITLDTGASANDGAYVQHLIKIASGTGAGQFRTVSAYVGSTNVATVTPAWSTTPDSSSVFWIEPFPQANVGMYVSGMDPASLVLATPADKLTTDSSGRVQVQSGTGTGQISTTAGVVSANAVQIAGQSTSAPGSGGVTFPSSVAANNEIRSATAQGGGSSTITLDSGASGTNSFYNGENIELVGGTGAGQTRQITGYVGSTKVATVATAWAVNPDNTSQFKILASAAGGSVNVGSITSGAITSTAFASGAVTAGSLFQVDGLAIDSALIAMLATLLGTTTVSGNTVDFHKQDGSTTKVAITYGSTAGQRTASTVS